MNIIVAGAGTAGWLAALYANKKYPDCNVTVIHDDKTPIIGVGEGTTPLFSAFMKMLDISIEELIKNCDATIKNGIKFTNWKGDGTHYQHTFLDNKEIHKTLFTALSNKINLDDIVLGATLSNNNKIPFSIDNKENVDSDTGYALHFDAKKMAEYLQSVGVSRGIKKVVGKIKDIRLDKDDFVSEIILDTNKIIKPNFVFDCTGFSRVFVNKVYNSPLKSYKEFLPVKKAMPFFLDKTGTTPPFTEAIAMKYGWMWKIPVGKRYGCGYVFDSDYITDEEAYEEICEVTKQKPHIPRTLSFKPEYNVKPFNKNTLALGLSHGFLEPIEATSLLIVINMLVVLNQTGCDIFEHTNNDLHTEMYNKIVLNYVENCVNMVYIHYLTPREDTDFWKKFKNNIPTSVYNILNKIKNFDSKHPDEELIHRKPFGIYNFLKCMAGVDYIHQDTIKKNVSESEDVYLKLKNIQNICKKSKNHDEYLTYCSNT